MLPHPEDADSPTGYYLTVTETVVKKVFPTVEDLPLLVHVREVDLRDTELANGDDDGWLAVVLANRLPIAVPATDPHSGQPVSAPVRYLACLLNLEGQVDALPTDADLDTDDTFHLVAAVQDLSLVATTAASTDLVVMGTGHPVRFGAVPLEVEDVDAEAAIARATSVVAAGRGHAGRQRRRSRTWASFLRPRRPRRPRRSRPSTPASRCARRWRAAGPSRSRRSCWRRRTASRCWPTGRSPRPTTVTSARSSRRSTWDSSAPSTGRCSGRPERHGPDHEGRARPPPRPEGARGRPLASWPRPVTSRCPRRPGGARPPPPGTGGRSGRCPPTATPSDSPLAHVSDQLRTLTPDGP